MQCNVSTCIDAQLTVVKLLMLASDLQCILLQQLCRMYSSLMDMRSLGACLK